MKNILIIGAGIIGKSWEKVFLRNNYHITFYDIITQQSEFNDLESAVKNIDYIQECIIENSNEKIKLYQKLDEILDKKTFVGSSTSSIPGSKFMGDLYISPRCLVVHPINPPHLIPLVEIVPTSQTSNETINFTMKLMKKVKQTPIFIKKEINGFVVNRIQAALLNEIFRLIEDNIIDPNDVDQIMTDGLGRRWSFMGPLETIDLNAPKGIEDYINRYGSTMYQLALEQSDPREWKGNYIQNIIKMRRDKLKIDDIQKRIEWRDHNLRKLFQ